MAAEVEVDLGGRAGRVEVNMSRAGDLNPAGKDLMTGDADDEPTLGVDDEVGLALTKLGLGEVKPGAGAPVWNPSSSVPSTAVTSWSRCIEYNRGGALG